MGKALDEVRQFFRDNPDFKARKLTEEEKRQQINPGSEQKPTEPPQPITGSDEPDQGAQV